MVTFITRMLQSEAVAKERAYAASAEREAEFIEEDDKAPSDAAEVDRAAGEGTSQQQQQAQPVYYQCRLPNGQVVLIAPGLMTMAPPATAPVSTGDDSSVAEGGESAVSQPTAAPGGSEPTVVGSVHALPAVPVPGGSFIPFGPPEGGFMPFPSGVPVGSPYILLPPGNGGGYPFMMPPYTPLPAPPVHTSIAALNAFASRLPTTVLSPSMVIAKFFAVFADWWWREHSVDLAFNELVRVRASDCLTVVHLYPTVVIGASSSFSVYPCLSDSLCLCPYVVTFFLCSFGACLCACICASL